MKKGSQKVLETNSTETVEALYYPKHNVLSKAGQVRSSECLVNGLLTSQSRLE